MSGCGGQEQGGTTVDKRPMSWQSVLVAPGGIGSSVLSGPFPMVVLRHEEPGGGQHWDVLIARSPQQDPANAHANGLMGFRVPSPPQEAAVGTSLLMTWTPDHDRSWLTREGEVSGDRGVAWRVCAGELEIHQETTAVITWCDGQQAQWQLHAHDDGPSLCVTG